MTDAATARAYVGWRTVPFGEAVRNVTERAEPVAEDSDLYVGLEHLDSGSLAVRRWGSERELDGTKLRMRKGDVLFAKRNAYLRRVAIAPHDGLFSAHGMVLRANPVLMLHDFLPFFMQSDHFWDRAIGISVGSLSPTINWTTLAKEEFALPPIEEQRRIVCCLAAARSAAEQMERLVDEAGTLLTAAIDDQMRDYPVRTIGQLVDDRVLAAPQDGNHGDRHPKEADYTAEGVPFIMAADLREGAVDFASCKKLREDHARSLRIGFAKNGDILLSHKGTVGSVARLQDIPAPFAMLTPQVTYYRSLEQEQLLPDWLYFAFQSTNFQSLLLQRGRQSTRAYIGITAQRELSIPYCDVGRQQQHVKVLLQIEGALKQAANRVCAIRTLQHVLASEWVPA